MADIDSSAPTPAISVVMPVYNAAAFLEAAIDSVLAQTMGDFEFLIIDDGSTDGSPDIIRRYDDPRIRFVTRENRGAVATRNELGALARAPYLAVMDADDICLPDRLEKQYAFLESHGDIGLLGGRATYVDVVGRPIFMPELPTDPTIKNLIGIWSARVVVIPKMWPWNC